MRAEIISVGTELLLGDIVNTNAQFLAQELAGLGYEVYYQTVVGDNRARLRKLIGEARERSELLVFTGGLGPTDDDLTKETVAEAFGDVLVRDAEEEVKLEHFFKKRGLSMTENNRKQALVPKRGQKITNPNGTAPGAYFRQGGKFAILLPGPPREMQPMFTEQVVPLLAAMQDSAIRSLTLRVFGLGESELESRVAEYLNGSNPTAALYAKTGEVHIRITAKAESAEAAEAMCEDYARLFLRTLGDLVYSVNGDNLETTCVKLLIEEGATLATAESCTGGLLGERITGVPGASAVYGYGCITYANEAKHDMLRVRNATLSQYGAVSSQVAAEMAFGAAARAGDTYGMAITGIAGPDGGSTEKPVGLVYIALAHGREVLVKKMNAPDRGREHVRHMATQNALDMLRRQLLGLHVAGARQFDKSQEADLERGGKPRRRGGPLRRAALAVLLALVLFALLVGGLSLLRGGPRDKAPSSGLPSAQGLDYGSDEYTLAACELVEREREADPDVAGLVALPGALVESLVRSVPAAQAALAEEAGAGGAALSSGAAVARGARNTLLVGNVALAPLWDLRDGVAAAGLSTFTYYTPSDAKVYRVFAVFLAESGGSFDPAAERLPSYGAFLNFTLGARARSLFDIPVDLLPGDSFMTLAAADPEKPGQSLYVCGRLSRLDEAPPQAAAVPAANALMPADWYAERGEIAPGEAEVYDYWMRWYLTRNDTNPELQLAAGLAAEDKMPLVTTQPSPAASGAALAARPAGGGFVRLAAEGGDGGDGGDAGGRMGEASSAPESNAAQQDSASAAPGSNTAAGSSPSESQPQAPSSSSASLYVPPRQVPQMPDPAYLTVTLNGRRLTDTTKNVLAQICQAEAPGGEPALVKAVAVAAHSWILNRQGAGDEAPAVVGRQPSASVLAAVGEVADMILAFGGDNPAFCPWYELAAYGSSQALDVWGLGRSYLITVPSPYDADFEGWRSIISLPREEFAAMVQQNLGVDLSQTEDAALWVTDIVKNEGGYVQSLSLGGVEVSGTTLWRQVLLRDGAPLLRSSAFEVEHEGDSIVFINYGAGHGCGMSLAGAASYAREGWGFEQILEHYYPSTELIQLQ